MSLQPGRLQPPFLNSTTDGVATADPAAVTQMNSWAVALGPRTANSISQHFLNPAYPKLSIYRKNMLGGGN